LNVDAFDHADRAEEGEMARQILKGLAMLMMIVGLALATAVSASGQSNERAIVQVPFDFIGATRDFRAGNYDVRVINKAGDVLSIRNADSNAQEISLMHDSLAKSGQALNAKLVFHRYGNTYFLSQVWMAGDNTGRELTMSRQERAIERELKAIASNRGDNRTLYEVVEVIATTR
jgi:hypothetical protein